MTTGILLIIGVVLFRLGTTGTELANFSPLLAVFLCGAAYLSGRVAVWVPFAAFLISDIALNLNNGTPVFGAMTLLLLGTFGVVWLIGQQWKLRRGSKLMLFGGCVASTLFFFVITNTYAFAFNPTYAKSFPGWIQALTIGQPGYPPTLWFLAKSLAGNLLFTAAFMMAFEYAHRLRTVDRPEAAAG